MDEHSESLQDNYSNGNLPRTLVKTFRENRDFHNQYNDVISKHITQEIAERVNKNKNGDNSKTYYITHQMIIREDKTTTEKRNVLKVILSELNFPSLYDCRSKLNDRYTNTSFTVPLK